MLSTTKTKVVAIVVLLALIILPAPLIPPPGLTEVVQSLFGVGVKTAYLVAAIGLRVALYGSIGAAAAFAVNPGETRRQRILRLVFVPIVAVGISLVVRSIKLGYVPMAANAVVPLGACVLGVSAGLLFRQHGWRVALGAIAVLTAGLAWTCWPGVSSRLGRATELQLRQIAAIPPGTPTGDGRFAVVMCAAFAAAPSASASSTAAEHNSAAILALGIALGDERLARFVGLDGKGELVHSAAGVRAGTTLRGRADWAQHYCVSAALTVVENPFVSDAGGLIKEELDALGRGSGFSFGDLAADRAGVRFAVAATGSEASAEAMQARLKAGFAVDDYFPAVSDLPENLTTEQFRRDFEGVGSARYRKVISEIESRLDRCAALLAKGSKS